jgi:single-stranded-DNA-specific exonuclease
MTSNNMTRWLDPAPVNVPASFADLNLHPLIAQTLVRRGITTPEAVGAFLHPDSLPSPPYPNIQSAVERIDLAMRNNESVCVWGDFDVDGQTSTALLVQTLQAIGANVTYHIPIRGVSSHGVHLPELTEIITRGAKLILTCDTGITANEEVEYAKSQGVDFIITDHHDLGETLPKAVAIINPKLLPKDHPLTNLAGVGVAYKLAEALFDRGRQTMDNGSSVVSRPSSEDLLDLVALGLIADVALLKGETRALAQKGIQALRNTNRLGLKIIAEFSNTKLETLTEEQIGFVFAPRLNALGRLSDANPAVELLLTQDPARARVLAAQIEGLNAQRKLLTSQVYEAAEAQLSENPDLLTEPVIVLSHPNWPGGVVGIVANKLVDRYHKPALLLNESDDGIMRGSARSIEGLHITEAIAANKDLLRSFGGHPMAAGLSLSMENLSAFRKGLGKAVEKQLGESVHEEPTLQIDAWLSLNEINFELANALESLSPFGAGNPPLVLASRGVQLKSVSTIGRAKEHVRLNLEDDSGDRQSVTWWGGGEELPNLSTSIGGNKFDIAYSLRASTYRGQKQLTLQFEEFRVTEEKAIEVKLRKIEVIDYRLESVSSLEKLREQAPALQIYAEGEDRKRLNGVDRYNLSSSKELAFYTTPASLTELRAIMDKAKPQKVYLFSVLPPEDPSATLRASKSDEFLTRLTGMTKFVINQRNGKTSIQELCTATAHREATIRFGLEWLAAGGHIAIQNENDEYQLSAGNGKGDPYLQKELYIAVKGLLEETAAYRKYFTTTTDPKGLLEL